MLLLFAELLLAALLLDCREERVELPLLEWVLEEQHLAWSKVDRVQVMQDLRVSILERTSVHQGTVGRLLL